MTAEQRFIFETVIESVESQILTRVQMKEIIALAVANSATT